MGSGQDEEDFVHGLPRLAVFITPEGEQEQLHHSFDCTLREVYKKRNTIGLPIKGVLSAVSASSFTDLEEVYSVLQLHHSNSD